MYLYNMTGDKLISSVLEIYRENEETFVKFYNGYKRDNYLDCAYRYTGSDELEKYKKKLHINKDELREIQKNNAWVLQNKIYDEFYYDL